MWSPLAYALLATLVISGISLAGVAFLLAGWNDRRARLLVGFAAGVLLASPCLDLLPEAVARHRGDGNLFLATLAGMCGFLVLEHVLHGLGTTSTVDHAATLGYLVLIGDAVHNFIDGVVIAAMFLVDPALGVSTALAVAAHELPQELGDFGILVHSGFSPPHALAVNFVSALAAVAGALVCVAVATRIEPYLPWLMAATAGMFIYIATTTMVPQLHHGRAGHDRRLVAAFFAGIGVVALLRAVTTHMR